MTLTTTDKERLTELLEKNRGGGRGGYTPQELDPVTDDSVVLVRRGEWNNDARYHKCADGDPACRAESESGYRTSPLEEAAAHRGHCRYCWPDGAPDVGSETDSGEVGDR